MGRADGRQYRSVCWRFSYGIFLGAYGEKTISLSVNKYRLDANQVFPDIFNRTFCPEKTSSPFCVCTRQACLACPLYFSIIYITHLPLKRLRKILEDLFIAQGQRPAGLESVKWTELDAIQRVLLTADGTVTQLIEAYLSQPIEIVVLGQQIRQLEHDDPWLVAASGTEVCERQVLLCGRDRVAYLHAVSSIVMDRVPA